MNNSNKTLVIIPIRNKEKFLINLIDYLKKYQFSFDFIFVNNASSDRSEELLKLNKVSYLSSTYLLSYKNCLKIGLEYAKLAKYEIIIEFGDIFVDYENINKLINNFQGNNLDMIIGQRNIKSRSLIFKEEKILRFFNHLISKKKIHDINSKTKIFNSKILSFTSQKENYSLEPDDITFLVLNKYIIKNIILNISKKYPTKTPIGTRAKGIRMIFIWILLIIFVIPFRRKIWNRKKNKKGGI